MEITNDYKLEWLKVEKFSDGVIVYCPAIHEGLEGKPNKIGKFRKIVSELKELEKKLAKDFPYWVMYTDLKNEHIMRILKKLGCVPYDINLQQNTLWFVKRLS